MTDQFREVNGTPQDLVRQFKDLGTTDPQGRPVYAEVLALEPASIGGGGGGVASAVAIADGVSSAIKATVTGANALKVDPSAVTQPISAASLPLPAGAATETTLAAVNTKLAGTLAVSGTFWQATQPVSAASLPLPTGAAADATLTNRTQKAQITDGTRDGTVKAASTLPVATDTALVVTLRDSAAVTGTFWQATQPISAASLPLPTGAATETTLAAISGKLPATLGQKTMANSLAVVLASDQTAVPVSGTFWQATQPVSGTVTANQGGAPWSQNLTQVGGTAITAKSLPTGADGQAALPVWVNSMAYLTYDVGARGIVSGALVAGTPKAIMSLEHAATSTKTVRIRRITVHFIQTTGLSGAIDIQITRGTAASSAGTAVTPQPRKSGDAAAEVTVKTLPTITAATIADNIPVGGFATTTTLYSPPFIVYDWQEGANTKALELTAGALQSIVINVVSTAAHNLTMTVSVDLTEE